MGCRYLFKNESSCIAIRNDKLYVISTRYKDYSPRAIQILPGFQLELGRSIQDFKEALKETRLPVIIKKLIERGDATHYQIIRMHTGNVDDKVVASIACRDDIIKVIAFNRALIKDMAYRRYNQLSTYNQLSLPYNLEGTGCMNRTEQVKKSLSAVTMSNNAEVKESGKKLTATVDADGQKMIFTFILNATNRYELSNISI